MTNDAETTFRAAAGVVLAGGTGERFGTHKQYARLGDERLVDRAVRLLRPFSHFVVVVLPAGHAWTGAPVSATAVGGSTRTESMRAAMAVIPADVQWIVAHDVVRPFATGRVVQNLLDAVRGGADAAIPVWAPPDTVKRIQPDGSVTHAGREEFVIAQSPLAFRAESLRRMFDELSEIPIEETVGIERIGGRVVGVAGDRWSQHLVEPRDLELMGRLLDPIEDESGE